MPLPSFTSQLSLDEQLKALKDQIRQAPASVPLRVYYFQLLCVLGEWQKALEQLQLCAQLDPSCEPMARAYREAIRCEVLRAEVFAGKKKPFLMGEPAQWLACLIDALAHEGAAAEDLRARAREEAPATAGHMGEHRFEWLADSDTRLGPVCELLAHGSYYWLPFDAIAQIGFEPVQDLRDLIWLPCEVTLREGGALQGFMPARYPLAPGDDDAVRMSRRTQWSPLDTGSSDPDESSGHGAGGGPSASGTTPREEGAGPPASSRHRANARPALPVFSPGCLSVSGPVASIGHKPRPGQCPAGGRVRKPRGRQCLADRSRYRLD